MELFSSSRNSPSSHVSETSSLAYQCHCRRCVSRLYMNVVTTLLVFVLTMPTNCVDGYPIGAPDTACSSMLPSHNGTNPQQSTSPYNITATSSTYTPGQQIQVTLTGGIFEGFLLQGRISSNQASAGQFTSTPSNAKTICSNQAVTHTDKNEKSSMTVTWTAPGTAGQGNISFVATVVKDFSTYWTPITSINIVEVTATGNASSATLPLPSTTTTTTNPSKLSTTTYQTTSSECGQAMSCYHGQLDRCSGSCDFLLAWSLVNTETIEFNLIVSVTSNDKWVAFGLSTNGLMSPASVVECVYDDTSGFIKVLASQNVGGGNYLLSNDQLGLVPGSTSGEYSQGKIACRFQRLLSVTSQQSRRRKRQSSTDTVYPLDTAVYYILIARGPVSGGVKQYHSSLVVSPEAVNFTMSSQLSGSSSLTENLVKAHGVLMVLAWMVFASFGVLMPRYCKLAWPDTTWGGKKVWFQIHQPCMIVTLLLTTAGFIIIFCEARKYVTLIGPTVAHPPLGIIVMILVLANPIMAIFRCDPGTKNRPIFNVFHFIVGFLAHATAVTTIFLGLYMHFLQLPLWTKGVMILYICFHALVEIVLAIHMHIGKCRTKTDKPLSYDNDVPMEPKGSSARLDSQMTIKSAKNSSSTFISVALAVHLAGCVGCAVAISVQICLS